MFHKLNEYCNMGQFRGVNNPALLGHTQLYHKYKLTGNFFMFTRIKLHNHNVTLFLISRDGTFLEYKYSTSKRHI